MNKTKKALIILIILIIAITFGLALCLSNIRADRMNAYAIAHDCTWHYGYYLNEEPVCK